MSERKKIREDSIASELLTVMFFVHSCWKSDLIAYAKQFVTNSAVTQNIKQLLKKGYIEQIDEKRLLHTVYRITTIGRNYVIDHGGEDSYFERFTDGKEFIPSYFRSNNTERQLRGLSIARVQLIVLTANHDGERVRVFPNEKPSLRGLIAFLSADYNPNGIKAGGKYCAMKAGTLETVLTKAGLFYTAAEFSEYRNQYLAGSADKFNGSRFAGLFISSEKIMIIYINKAKSGDKVLSIHPQTEEELIYTLETIRNKFYRDYMQTWSDIDALVMTNGHATIRTMITGFKSGVNKRGYIRQIKADLTGEEIEPAPLVYDGYGETGADAPDYKLKRNRVFLQHGISIFKRVYALCVRDQSAGEQLSSILFRSSEEHEKRYIERGKALDKAYEEYLRKNGKEYIPTAGYYIPFFEVNRLCDIRFEINESFFNGIESKLILINTHKDMADTVALCIAKPAKYFDMKYRQINYRGEYSRYGFRKDKPDRYGRDFRNKAQEELRGSENKQKKELWAKLSVDMDPASYKQLKKIAAAKGITMSKYARDILVPRIKADIDEAKERV